MSSPSPQKNNSGPLQVGLTGGIGSGKSTVAKYWEVLGIPVFYADAEAKAILASDPETVRRVQALLGSDSYTESGPDRAYIAKQIFDNREKREALNSIIHPAVNRAFEARVRENAAHPYVIKEAAIIIETGAAEKYDALVLVTAPESLREDRAVGRGDDRSDVRKRMKAQLTDEEKAKYSDFVIVNDNERAIIPQVARIHSALLARSRGEEKGG